MGDRRWESDMLPTGSEAALSPPPVVFIKCPERRTDAERMIWPQCALSRTASADNARVRPSKEKVHAYARKHRQASHSPDADRFPDWSLDILPSLRSHSRVRCLWRRVGQRRVVCHGGWLDRCPWCSDTGIY